MLIVIPFSLPWKWSTDYTNQTAFVLAQNNIVICYMWCDRITIKECIKARRFPKLIDNYSQNIYFFNPLLFLPLRRFRFIESFNEQLMHFIFKIFVDFMSIKSGLKKKVLWIFDPNFRYLRDKLGGSWTTVYDCVDFFQVGTKDYIEKVRNNESILCKEADVVVANSKVLQDHLSKYCKHVGLVPQGFRLFDFKKPIRKINNLKIKHPIIGYVGGLNKRLDYNLLYLLAKRHPEWNFVIWGPIIDKENIKLDTWRKMQSLVALPNVKNGESKEKAEIPGLLSQFDIGIIPYDAKQDFNKNCYPMKLFEYFYLGLPVISTEIIELHRFPDLVMIGSTYLEWENLIQKTLKTKWSENKKSKARKLAIKNSWHNKVSQIVHFLNK